MVMVLIGVLCYWQAEAVASIFGGGAALPMVIHCSLALTGFAVYGPIALIGIQALSFVPKNAAGTAAGFVGLFGYLLGDAVLSKIIVGQVAGSNLGWGVTFWMFTIACVVATAICAITWRKEAVMMQQRAQQ